MLYPFWIYWTVMSNNSLQNFYSSRHVRFYIYVHECVYILVCFTQWRDRHHHHHRNIWIPTWENVYTYKKMKRKMCSLFICERNYVLLWVVVKFFYTSVSLFVTIVFFCENIRHGGGGIIVWLCCCSIKNFQKPWKNMRYFIIENLNTWIDCLHTWWKSTIWMEWNNFAWSFWVVFVIFTFV